MIIIIIIIMIIIEIVIVVVIILKYQTNNVNVNIYCFAKFMGFWLRRFPFTYCWARVCGAILIFISRMCLHC